MTLGTAVDRGPLFPRDRDRHPPAFTPGYKTSVTRAPQRPLVALGSTLSEETGPAFGHDVLGPLDNDLVLNFTGRPAIGERIILHGRVLDETGDSMTVEAQYLVEDHQGHIWSDTRATLTYHFRDGLLSGMTIIGGF